LKELAVRRNKDHAHYDASIKDHAAIIGAIEQVVSQLVKLRGSVSGVGKPSHVGAIANERRDAAWKAGVRKSFVEITGEDNEETNTFIELATEADQAALEKLIVLLNSILRNTKKSLSDDERAEAQSVNSFNKIKATLESDIQNLENLLKRQRTNLDQYQKRVTDLTLTINIRTSLQRSRDLELRNAVKERKDKKDRFTAETAQRNKEKEVIQRVQKIVKERLTAMSRFLKTSVNK